MDYLRYSDSVEVMQPDEDRLGDEIVASMSAINRAVFDRHRHATRDAHAKSHGILKGELIVDADLPAHLAQGLFAQAGRYDVIIRLSSAPGDIHSDKVPALRGMAIKVLGVAGERLLAGDAGATQDFLLVSAPTIPFGHVRAYHEFQHALQQLDGVPDALQEAAAALARGAQTVFDAVGVKAPLLVTGQSIPNDHILGETFHSMAAIRFGDHVAKISAAPDSPEVRALTGVAVDPGEGYSVLRDMVVEFFRRQGAEYRLRAQLCTDLSTMPVEDASVVWPEQASPHQPIARLVIPRQEAYSAARRVFGDDVLSFNPWHGIAPHRPLGSIMRVRAKAYEASSAFRHAMNVQPRVEPTAISELPD
jgi:hypothetical protein